MRPYNPDRKTYRGVRLLDEPTTPQVLDTAVSCDFYEENHGLTYEENFDTEELKDVVEKMLGMLTPREAKILRSRFGIGVPSDQTLEEVGRQFSVNGQRIREIEAKALRKLRHPSRSGLLEAFV